MQIRILSGRGDYLMESASPDLPLAIALGEVLHEDVERLVHYALLVEPGDFTLEGWASMSVRELQDRFPLDTPITLVITAPGGGGGISWEQILALAGHIADALTLVDFLKPVVRRLREKFAAHPTQGAWDVSRTLLTRSAWNAVDLRDALGIPLDDARLLLRGYGYRYNRKSLRYELDGDEATLGNLLLESALSDLRKVQGRLHTPD